MPPADTGVEIGEVETKVRLRPVIWTFFVSSTVAVMFSVLLTFTVTSPFTAFGVLMVMDCGAHTETKPAFDVMLPAPVPRDAVTIDEPGALARKMPRLFASKVPICAVCKVKMGRPAS